MRQKSVINDSKFGRKSKAHNVRMIYKLSLVLTTRGPKVCVRYLNLITKSQSFNSDCQYCNIIIGILQAYMLIITRRCV